MRRLILGVIGGFAVWEVLWIGSDAVLMAASEWYGNHQRNFEAALTADQPFAVEPTILLIGLIRSVIFSLLGGFVAATIARENTLSTIILGILLLAFGIFIQAIYWNYVPLWYHIPFLLLLIPAIFAGGKLSKRSV